MTDWNGAINLFVAGVVGVMLVMALLQVSIQLSSRIVRAFEARSQKRRAGINKSI